MLGVVLIDESQAGPPPEPDNFVGRVRMQRLADELDVDALELYAVHFDSGAHTRPHAHSTDQVLVFVSGNGFVWLAGEELQRAEQGSVIRVRAGIVHMHGATADEPICHLALRQAGPTDWHPAVPDDWRRFQSA